MKARLLILCSFFLFITGCPQQEPDMKNAIRLQSRIFVPKAGIGNKLDNYFELQKTKRVHVIIQFDKVPSLEQRKLLREQHDIILLDALPERAYYASVPRQYKAVKSLPGTSSIRWIGLIRNEDRLAPYLIKPGVPEHARVEKSRAELIVEFFSDVSEKQQKAILDSYKAEIVNRVEPLNAWSIILPESSITKISSKDEVKLITAIPEPPVDDNDGIRSASGTNADAVKAASLYGLTGAGVTVAQWEGRHASFTHLDHMARITLGDPPLPFNQRGYFHDESVAVNNQYDNGERVYIDVDDSGTVTVNDLRITPIPPLLGNVVVAAGDADIGTAFVAFAQFPSPYDGFTNTTAPFNLYNDGEAIYSDNDGNGRVSNGDLRRTPADTYAAGSIVVGPPNPAPADTDVNRPLTALRDAPHAHATHVAGTILGDGSQSFAAGGTAGQWQGIAPSANLRSYDGPPMTTVPLATDEYTDAANNGATISSNSFGTSHCFQIGAANSCYDTGSQYIDAVVSGRRSDGTPSGVANRMLVVSSAGNQGRFGERYVDDTPANGQYDTGESIYWDNDDGVVSGGDIRLLGVVKANGTALTNFTSFEMHGESIDIGGHYDNGEGIYLDVDASRSITVGDTRITAAPASGYADGSAVAAGDTDLNAVLKWFLPNGTVRIPNSAKNTMEVASIASDSKVLSGFSSRGPAYDGRFKPDIAAPGCEQGGEGAVKSSTPGNTYGLICGTSMSTPAVAGSAALLEEWYRSTCDAAGSTPDILRALFLHSAEDLTTIPNFGGGYNGPDFAFGYGRLRTKAAVDLLPNYVKASTAAVGSTDYNVIIGVMDKLKVTLVWDDPAWVSGSAPSLATGRLQNDLDLLLIAPDGTQYTPWIADSTNLFAPAVRSVIAAGTPVPVSAEDHRNNVEQVEVPNAMAGTWTIRVTASTLALPAQDYVLVSEALPTNATACNVNPAVDVYVRDNPTDDGSVVPSTGAMYLSPDIWNRNTDDGLTNDSQQNPEFGQVNYLYARVHNSSPTASVRAITTDAWIGTLSLGLAWPEAFTHVGRFHFPNLAPGESRIVGPIEWYPPAAGHYCMYTRVQSPQDPITYAEGTSVWANANNSNNIAYRNMSIVDLASSKSISFLVRNVAKSDEDVEIEINVPPELLKVGEVKMMMSPELDSAWPEKLRDVPGLKAIKGEYQTIRPFQLSKALQEHYKLPVMQKPQQEKKYRRPETIELKLPIYKVGAKRTRIRGVHMKAAQADRMTLTFGSRQTRKATYNVHVVQKVKGKPVGGILFVVRTGFAKK